MLKGAGVDMSKISIEDINKALKLREEALLNSRKRFSYLQPVTERAEIIYDIDKGTKVGYIDLRKPFSYNGGRFTDEAWNFYITNPKNRGLRVGMVENLSKTTPNAYSKTYKGVQERLTNSAIDVAHQ